MANEIKLPEHPSIYLILFALIIGLSLPIVGRVSILVYFLFSAAAIILALIGYNGLKKTQDLKDKKAKIDIDKTQAEIELIKAQQFKTSMDFGQLFNNKR